MRRRLDQYWYKPNLLAFLLLPLAGLFCLAAILRRLAYRLGWLSSHALPVPVIIVGNITVGGSGKTPLVIWLARWLQQQGWQPGIISRGYGGLASHWPQPVHADSDPRVVGDEPVLTVQRSGVPMWVGPDRLAAGQALLRAHHCNILIADDGMQHYRLQRDIEIAVLDGVRRLGNGFCLPAGPLREPAGRLATVDLCVSNGPAEEGEHAMRLQPEKCIHLPDGREQALESLRGKTVHAVAGIANPARFFSMLRGYGIRVIEHAFPDHYRYSVADMSFADNLPVLMTEKDGVKCRAFARDGFWVVPVDAVLPEEFSEMLLSLLPR